MKNINKYIILCIILLTVTVCISCTKGDNQKAWGISEIYMPQASILDGGLTNNYPVPLIASNGVINYNLDSVKNIIDIPLGVYRSDMEALNSYSVKVLADIDTTNQIIAGGTISNAVLLPADVYTLPADVSVLDGQRDATFHLTIDRAKLVANYSSYFDKKLLLTVEISNPSRYILNQSISKTVIIIDATTFMP